MTIETAVRPPDLQPERKVFGISIPQRSGGGGAPIVVGGQPRANLLPPEVILKRKQLKTRRALRFGVLLVAIAVAAGCVGAFGVGTAAQLQLDAVTATQADLVAQQAKYSEVKQLKDTIATIGAGQQVGASTEIDWSGYLTKLQATLPAGVQLASVAIEEGTPMIAFKQSESPLAGSNMVASLAFTATSSTLPTIPDWLRAMAKLKGFVDATPGSVVYEGGVYTTQVLMHINTDAFTLRYDPATVAAAAAKQAADAAAAAAAKPTPAPSDSATPGPSSTPDSEGN